MQNFYFSYLKNRNFCPYPKVPSENFETTFHFEKVLKIFDGPVKKTKFNIQTNVLNYLTFLQNQKVLKEKIFLPTSLFFKKFFNPTLFLYSLTLYTKNKIYFTMCNQTKNNKVCYLAKEKIQHFLNFLMFKKKKLVNYFFEFAGLHLYNDFSKKNLNLRKMNKNETTSFVEQFNLKKPSKEPSVLLNENFHNALGFYMLELWKKRFSFVSVSKMHFSELLSNRISFNNFSTSTVLKIWNLESFFKTQEKFFGDFFLSKYQPFETKKFESCLVLDSKQIKYQFYFFKQLFHKTSSYFSEHCFLDFFNLTNFCYRFVSSYWCNPSNFIDFLLNLKKVPTQMKSLNLTKIFQSTGNSMIIQTQPETIFYFFSTIFFQKNINIEKLLFDKLKKQTLVFFVEQNKGNENVWSFFPLLKISNFSLNFSYHLKIEKTFFVLNSKLTLKNKLNSQFLNFMNSFATWFYVSVSHISGFENQNKLFQRNLNICFNPKKSLFLNENKLKQNLSNYLKRKEFLQITKTLFNKMFFEKTQFTYLKQLKQILKANASQNQLTLIKKVSPNLLSYCYFYRYVLVKKSFQYLDKQFFTKLWRWSCRRHNNKSKKWIQEKYFFNLNKEKWVFAYYTLNSSSCSNLKKQSAKLQYLPSHSQLFKIFKKVEIFN